MAELQLQNYFYRYKKTILYYIQPWDGLFYKSNKFDKYSVESFKVLTNLSFHKFYETYCKSTNKSVYAPR